MKLLFAFWAAVVSAEEACSFEEADDVALLDVSLLQTSLQLKPAAAVQETPPGRLREGLAVSLAELTPPPRATWVLLSAVILMAIGLILWTCMESSGNESSEDESSDDETSPSKIGVYGILITQTLNALATMVVLPTMPFYAMNLGASAFTISLMGSAYNLAQMFCSPLLGSFSDRVGRKRVMLMGIFGQAVCNVLMCRARTVPSLLFARVAVGMALSTGPVEMAYIMDFVDDEQELSRILALQRVMTSAGALAGPIVARSFDSLPFPVLCRGVVAINVLNLVVGAMLWEDAVTPSEAAPRTKCSKQLSRRLSDVAEEDIRKATSSGSQAEGASMAQKFQAMCSNRATCCLLGVSFVYALGFGIGDGPEMVFFKERFGFGKDQACVFFIFINVSSLVCAAWVPALLSNLGARNICVIACLGGAMCSLLLALSPGVLWMPFAFGATMVGLCGTMLGLGFMHLVRETVPEDLMGTMLGFQSSLNGAAGALAPPVGGMLYGWNNFLPFLVTSFCCVVTGVLYKLLPMKVEAVVPRRLEAKKEQAALRRLSTFGAPIYNDKSFMVQVITNELRLEFDPEAVRLYERFRERLREDNVRGGLKPVATVAGDLSASARDDELDASLQNRRVSAPCLENAGQE